MLTNQNDRHERAESRAFEELPHDTHGLFLFDVR
jgi:hypothetical protein